MVIRILAHSLIGMRNPNGLIPCLFEPVKPIGYDLPEHHVAALLQLSVDLMLAEDEMVIVIFRLFLLSPLRF